MSEKELIKFDPANLADMKKLMQEYGDDKTMKFGSNELGEDVAISIFKDKIVVTTNQSNGWVRKNIYYPTGEREELYEGKWNK